VLIILIIAASIIPLYGVIGLFAPRGARWGLRVPAEMFVLAVYFGGLYGAFQSYARALYAEIIPPGEEARWYGLFSITDKVCLPVSTADWAIYWSGGSQQSSSFFGPLVVGLVADLTGNIRYAFLFLVLMLWAALPVLAGVDVERGRADARAWSSSHGNDGDEMEVDDVVNGDR
jgi:UMF1 family MFS transporter